MGGICAGCGGNVGCGCQLNSEGLCASCAYRKSIGLPFERVVKFIKKLLSC